MFVVSLHTNKNIYNGNVVARSPDDRIGNCMGRPELAEARGRGETPLLALLGAGLGLLGGHSRLGRLLLGGAGLLGRCSLGLLHAAGLGGCLLGGGLLGSGLLGCWLSFGRHAGWLCCLAWISRRRETGSERSEYTVKFLSQSLIRTSPSS